MKVNFVKACQVSEVVMLLINFVKLITWLYNDLMLFQKKWKWFIFSLLL